MKPGECLRAGNTIPAIGWLLAWPGRLPAAQLPTLGHRPPLSHNHWPPQPFRHIPVPARPPAHLAMVPPDTPPLLPSTTLSTRAACLPYRFFRWSTTCAQASRGGGALPWGGCHGSLGVVCAVHRLN